MFAAAHWALRRPRPRLVVAVDSDGPIARPVHVISVFVDGLEDFYLLKAPVSCYPAPLIREATHDVLMMSAKEVAVRTDVHDEVLRSCAEGGRLCRRAYTDCIVLVSRIHGVEV